MSKFRTKKNNRTTYIYRDVYGRKIAELYPGEDDVTAAFIATLHEEDDTVHSTEKRDSYHGLLHYEQSGIDGEDMPDDRQLDLADYAADPDAMFFNTLEVTERSGAFKAVWDGLTDKQRDLVMKKLLKRTNTSIAKEENITEAAVRNRLSKIQKKFEKFLI